MKNEAIKVLHKKKQNILEGWLKFQLSDESLREDLMSNEELRSQSADLLDALLNNLNDSTSILGTLEKNVIFISLAMVVMPSGSSNK